MATMVRELLHCFGLEENISVGWVVMKYADIYLSMNLTPLVTFDDTISNQDQHQNLTVSFLTHISSFYQVSQ